MEWKLSEIKIGSKFNPSFKLFLDKPLIYKILFPNNKVYIGQTKNVIARIRNYLSEGRDDRFVTRAIKKYHQDNVIFSIVETCNQSDLNDREAYYISTFKSNDKMYGYNLTIGGNYGFKITSEITEKKIASNTNKKKVACYDLTGKLLQVYESLSAAERALNIPVQDIIRCCKSKNARMRNNLMFSKDLEDILEPYKPLEGGSKVSCYVFDKNGIFLSEHQSIKEAANVYNIPSSFARTYISKGCLIEGRFYISYSKDFQVPISKRLKLINVFDVISNVKVDSIFGLKACGSKYGLDYRILHSYIHKNREYEGLIFKYEC